MTPTPSRIAPRSQFCAPCLPEDRKAYLASSDVRKVIQAEDTVARIATIAAELVKNQPLILQAAAVMGTPEIAHTAVAYVQQVGTVQALVDKARDSIATVQRLTGAKPRVIGNGLLDLFEVWRTSGKTTKKTPRNYLATAKLFIDKIGDLTGDDITPDHVRAFYDMNAKDQLGPSAQIKHKEHLHAILKAAFSARRIKINPAAGIEVNNAAHAAKDTGEEETGTPFPKGVLRQVLAKAVNGFGKADRRADNLLALRVLVYSGMRPNECSQLRCADIIEVDGVACFKVWQGPGQSTKNVSSRRRLPMHKTIRADVLARVKAGGEWLLPTFPHDKPSQHSRWLCSDFGKFLRKDCGVTDPEVRLYSTRHTWKDALGRAMPDDEMRRRVMGKLKDQHERYGSGPLLAKMAEYIDAVDPLN